MSRLSINDGTFIREYTVRYHSDPLKTTTLQICRYTRRRTKKKKIGHLTLNWNVVLIKKCRVLIPSSNNQRTKVKIEIELCCKHSLCPTGSRIHVSKLQGLIVGNTRLVSTSVGKSFSEGYHHSFIFYCISTTKAKHFKRLFAIVNLLDSLSFFFFFTHFQSKRCLCSYLFISNLIIVTITIVNIINSIEQRNVRKL